MVVHLVNAKADHLRERAEKYISLFNPSKAVLRNCYNSFLQEICNGLHHHAKDSHSWDPAECSMMMLDCCIDFVPTGREKGVFYAVDFGGTNLRAIRCNLDGKGNPTIRALKHNIRDSKLGSGLPKGLLDKKATATMLFDDIANTVNELMIQEGDAHLKDVGVGFTFSFGVNLKSLRSATLIGWTKGFETGMETLDPVIDKDVCLLLDRAFARKKMNARLSAVLNDTVGAMLAGCYCKKIDDPPCLIGAILGTGMNGAYVQPDAKSYGYKGIVINAELGNFDKDLPENEIDKEIDFTSVSPGRQRFEKMCSGLYIPEIIRLLIIRVFQSSAPAAAWIPLTLTGEGCGAIYNDFPPYATTVQVFGDLWFWSPEPEQLEILHDLVFAVFHRSAAVSAVAIAAMAKSTGRLQRAMGGLTVGVDGSLYTQNPPYQKELRACLELVLNKNIADLINIVVAMDGSGTGAAILSAAIKCAGRRS